MLREHRDRPSHPAPFFSILLARIIHEGFYCNRRYAATTSLTAGGLVRSDPQRTARVRIGASRLRAPVSLGVSAVSSRTLVNNEG